MSSEQFPERIVHGRSAMLSLSLTSQMPLIASANCLIAAIFDLRTGHIPNWLTLGSLLLGPAVQMFLSHRALPNLSWQITLATSLLGIAVTGLVPFLLWKRDAMGGGDVKLLAAVGGLLGPMLGMQVELYAFLVALVLAPAKLAYEGKLLNTLKNTAAVALNPFRSKAKRVELPPAVLTEFRFGPAIFLGALFTTLVTR